MPDHRFVFRRLLRKPGFAALIHRVSPGAAFVALFLSGLPLFAAESQPLATIVDSAARIFMSDPRSVGISVGVLKDGKTSTFHYGSTSRGETNAPTERTLYPIASITKTFTGSLLALAATEGKLKLENDVRKFLKGEFPNLEFQGQPIRLRDLLAHRSGLPYILPDRPELRPGYQNEPIETHLDRLTRVWSRYTRGDFYADLRRVKLEASPGAQFKYSNAAAQLAGYLLEDVFRVSFEELVRTKIARPLGMVDTTIILSPNQLGRMTKGYEGNGALMPPPRHELQGAGALISSVADLLLYLQWHAEEKSPAIKLSHEPIFTEKNYSVGLNWQIIRSGDRRLIWQEGTVPGFTSYLLFEPELRLGLVVLTNESDPTSSRRIATMANEILKVMDPHSINLP